MLHCMVPRPSVLLCYCDGVLAGNPVPQLSRERTEGFGVDLVVLWDKTDAIPSQQSGLPGNHRSSVYVEYGSG
jgi:hypothetical protein